PVVYRHRDAGRAVDAGTGAARAAHASRHRGAVYLGLRRQHRAAWPLRPRRPPDRQALHARAARPKTPPRAGQARLGAPDPPIVIARSKATTQSRAETGERSGSMKFMWFHLMPYTELPDDFREKNPSVWVDIHSSLFDPRRAHHMYNDFMDELEFAAECGFDAVCVNEHHSNGYGLMPSPNLIAAALARRTTDTAICVMGNSLALYNPPTRVAEEFAMIDCISGGRLIAGFPVGTPMDTCYAYGQNPSQLRQRYLEAHDLVVRAWTERDTFAFNGRFNQQRYVNIWPRPIQRPHPPIWIPGGGSIETWQWCAERDYVYSYLSYYGHKVGQATMDGYWREMARLGKDRNPYRAGFAQTVAVAETREQAMELYTDAAEYFFGRCLHI